jgi:hypothetical protein
LNRRVRQAFAILITTVAACALTSCGDDPAPVKTIAASDFADPRAGVAFRAPAGARLGDGVGEQIVVLRRGQATLVISRFQRDQPLPRSGKELIRASNALRAEYAKRDSAEASSIKATRRTVGGRESVVVTDQSGNQHYHLYVYRTEIVIDLVAPASQRGDAQRALFDPVFDSLKITKPRD